MPRIAVCLNIADRDKPHFSGENEHLDYCRYCFRNVDDQEVAEDYGLPLRAVDLGCDHPPYDCDDYTCEGCGKSLTEEDE